jgi:capsular polysaccharide biosynthesis protein
MFLLSQFMTILRVDPAQGAIIHTPLWPAVETPPALTLDIPSKLPRAVTTPRLPGLTIEPAADKQVTLTKDGYDLCVHPSREAAFLRNQAEGRFPYLILPEIALGVLRDIIRHRWRVGMQSCTPCALEPFLLDFGAVTADLTQGFPVRAGSASKDCVLTVDGAKLPITRGEVLAPEILLRRRSASWPPHYVTSKGLLHETPDTRLTVAASTEMVALPITVCAEDHAWLYEKHTAGLPPISGPHVCEPAIAHESHKFVMLARHTEGNIFDEHGFSTEFGYCGGLGSETTGIHPMPPGMRREGTRLFVDRAALDAAPRLAGPHIVFTTPLLSNYFHWLLDGILPLTLLSAYAPPDAKLLLPATLRRLFKASPGICNHHDILRITGLAGLPMAEYAEPYVDVEDAYFLENGFIHNMPADCLREFRTRIMRDRKTPQRDLKLYITRRTMRRVSEESLVPRFMRHHGFSTHMLEDLSFDEQITLFSQAEFVVAPHGAGLANLLFCQPGTKVLELCPETEYRPFFAYMSSKLGLTHGIMPCPTTDQGFNGDLQPDMEKFAGLFRMLKHHL